MSESYISKTKLEPGHAVRGSDIRDHIFDLIRSEFPGFGKEDYISLPELNKYRRLYLTTLIAQEKGDLACIDTDVMDAIKNNSILSETIREELDGALTPGQKIADKVAAFGGSWAFIITFFSFIVLWMLTNVWFLSSGPFDPYPFILLNLLLSCLAAIQAPIIMMSQNRQEEKDRIRGQHDFKINLKAELEIKLLSEKIDHLLVYQSKRLLEIQELQTDYLEDLVNEIRIKPSD